MGKSENKKSEIFIEYLELTKNLEFYLEYFENIAYFYEIILSKISQKI